MTNVSNGLLTLNLNALKYNLQYFKKFLKPHTKTLCVVKAFAYGHDAVTLSRFIEKNKLADYFAVAYVSEGITLRENGIKLPILVLHAQPENYNLAIDYHLEPNLFSFRNLNEFIRVATEKKQKFYPIHLKFNSGLNRLGFNENEAHEVLKIVEQNKTLKVRSVFSHLAASEDLNEKAFTTNQIKQFENIKNVFEKIEDKPIFHLCNTSGVLNYPEAHYDMVRIGIGMYGFSNDPNHTKKLKNVASFTSHISQIHHLKKGDSVGYNRAYFVEEYLKTATIPIGHADGISRALGNKVGGVTINEQWCPIVGNVCMDMIMVDVTNVDCEEGDKVIYFDHQDTVNNIAIKTNTISYEILTGISQRIKRLTIGQQ